MKTALIFLHGDLSDISHIKPYAQKSDLIIAADGGAEHARKLNITPEIIIGDLDSIPADVKQFFEEKKVPFKVYPREKDFTDAALAIQYAIKQNVTDITIAGFFGKRLDHMMANLFHLSQMKESITILEGDERFFFIKKHTVITGIKGNELSLIPLVNNVEGITTSGLDYPLNKETLPVGSTRGISNVFSRTTATVSLKKGILLAIHRPH